MSASKGLKELVLNNRSRALSNVPVPHEKDLNEGPNFLAYKKCKRELSSRQKANE
jgi:hypothetical protein